MSDYVKGKELLGVKIAYVTPDDLGYGIARNYESFRFQEHVQTYVARSLDDAIALITK